MRRILGAEYPPRGCFAREAILLWRTRTVTPNCNQPQINNIQNLKRDEVFSVSVVQTPKMKSVLT